MDEPMFGSLGIRQRAALQDARWRDEVIDALARREWLRNDYRDVLG